MRIYILFILFSFLCGQEVFGQEENYVKRGRFPFMAFLYYPDSTSDPEVKFLRNAILIGPQWLISSQMDVNNGLNTFPQKTLMARAGSIVIDSKFSLNEDEYEQEREVVQIIEPMNLNKSEWWENDITLLKTLLPFNSSDVVSPTALPVKDAFTENICFILIYIRKPESTTEDRFLGKFDVRLLSPIQEKCGSRFRKDSMICASNSEEMTNAKLDPKFCAGNKGGPIICEKSVIGLQTYIDDCKEPYLYQLIYPWKKFISCGTEDKCHEEDCKNLCNVIDKDPHSSTKTEQVISSTSTTVTSTPQVLTEASEVPSAPLTDDETKNNETPERESANENKYASVETQTEQTSTSFETTRDTTDIKLTDQNKEAQKDEERTRKTNIEAKKLDRQTSSNGLYNVSSLYYLITTFLILVYIY